jgi:sigma-E factor negative regulatory protein RseA
MTDKIREQLSALLDDELSATESARLLDQLGQSRELRNQWDRYHLIGDVLRGETLHVSSKQIAERVRERIEMEPAIIAAPKPQSSASPAAPKKRASVQWLKPAAGVALAASVAAVTVVSLPQLTGDSDVSDNGILIASTQPINPPVQLVSSDRSSAYSRGSSMRWKNLSEPQIESKLNGYLVDHNEYAAPGGMNGVLPYATFVSYDAQR